MSAICIYLTKLPNISNGAKFLTISIVLIAIWLLVFDGVGLNLVFISSKLLNATVIYKPDPFHGSFNISNVPLSTRPDISDLACQFPTLDPWDKSIIHLIKHPRQFNCQFIQPWLTFVDAGGQLMFNQSELSHQMNLAGNENVTFRCQWKSVRKKDGSDWQIASSNYKSLNLSNEMRVNFEENCIQVQCFRNETIVYEFVHAYPRDMRNRSVSSDEDHLSVLMFLIDSVSLSMFRRSLPSTFKYITETMGANVFNGYNKVGENTFPNMVPILMNKRVDNAGPNLTDELGGGYRSIFFDDWNFIWKNFSQNGYLTAFIEDMPDCSTFHYLKKGFKKSSHDWYLRPYFLARQRSPIFNKSSTFCFGNTQRIAQELNISRAILERYNNSRYFVLTFSTDLSHDDIYQLEKADEDMLTYFKNLHDNNLLNKTVALVMADHGLRMTKIRNTPVGRIEERMPMYSIILPPWFYIKYPHIKKSLGHNANRLSTPFDVHSTLIDILNGNYRGSQRPLSQRSLSQFYDLPTNRTCLSAEIPLHFCTCQETTALNTTDPQVLLAATAIVDHLNYKLLANFSKTCAHLELLNVERAQTQTVNERVKAGHVSNKDIKKPTRKARNEPNNQIQLAVKVSPSDALFEGLVYVDQKTNKTTIANSISRINRYGNQSACMDDYRLRPFCYCITGSNSTKVN